MKPRHAQISMEYPYRTYTSTKHYYRILKPNAWPCNVSMLSLIICGFYLHALKPSLQYMLTFMYHLLDSTLETHPDQIKRWFLMLNKNNKQ